MEDGEYVGIITSASVLEHPHRLVGDCLSSCTHVDYNGGDATSVLERMKQDHLSVVPVFRDNEFMGVITWHGIIQYYREEREAKSRLASELEESRRAFHNIVERSGDGIVIIDDQGVVRYANISAARLFNRPQQKLVGVSLGVPIESGKVVEIDILRLDGQPGVAEMRVHPSQWENAPARLAFLSDITARKESEELQKRLIHADRLVAIGQLAAGVAHEINNPLAYVMANLTITSSHIAAIGPVLDSLREALDRGFGAEGAGLLDRVLSENSIARILTDMKEMASENLEGAERIRGIVKDLRSFSRIESDEIELVNLNDVINTACNMVFNEIRHRAKLVKDLGRLPMIAADRGKLTQVMTNLIVNAAQSIEEGAADENKIKVITSLQGEKVHIVIEDTGSGIPESVQKRIFEPFFTTKPRELGTGLGLSLSAELVRKHGGEISVSSALGEGSRFEVVLPVDTELAVTGLAVEPPAAVIPSAGRARILVIDDEAMILSAFKRVVGRIHEVVTAEGGGNGLDILEKDANFDVVICDLMMPKVDGVMVHEKIREIAPNLLDRVIFCSGGAFTARAKEFLATVENVVLEKPIDFKLLGRLIAQVRAKGST